MKRTYFPGLIDIVQLDTPAAIEEITQSRLFDRRFENRYPLINGLLLRHILGLLSYGGKRFPTLSAKDSPGRASEQELLWTALNQRAPALREGPDEVADLVRWMKGTGNDNELGICVQQLVGSQFCATYSATAESWEAALTLDSALRTSCPLTILRNWLTGKVRRAKRLLAVKVNGNLAGLHATGIALHNIVRSFQNMRNLYMHIGQRGSLSTEEVLRRCLAAPGVIFREATGSGTIAGCPFSKNTLFLVALAKAQAGNATAEIAFLKNSWSRCPADEWVPALLAGVWRRALRTT